MHKARRTKPNKPGTNIAEVKLALPQKGKRNIAVPLLIVFIIPVLIYLQTLRFGLTHFDDDALITNNQFVLSHFKNAKQLFLTDAFMEKKSPFYRPLQSLSYLIDIKLSGGNNTWMFHLTNILLLGCIACLLFLTLRQFSIQPEFAVLATLIYCVHPLFVSSVAWIPARGDLMLMLFSLLSFLFFVEYIKGRKIPFLLFHWLAFTTALFCKETAVFLPILFFLYLVVYSAGSVFSKRNFLTMMLYGASGILWYWIRSKAIGDISNRSDVFGIHAVIINLRTIPESLFMFFLPVKIPAIPGFTMLKTFIGSVIGLVILIFIFSGKERSVKEKLFCFAWFLLLIIPTFFFKHMLIDYLSHRFFLPLIGILLLVVFILPKAWTQQKNNKVIGAMTGLFILLGVITISDSQAYSNLTTFYNAAVERNPRSPIAYNNRGYNKELNNDHQGSLADFNKAIELNAKYDMAYNNRGYAKSNLGDKTGALEDYTSAINLNSKLPDPLYNRGKLNMSLGKYKDAIDDFNQYITMRPNYAEIYNLKGMALGSSGNLQEAITNFDKAIEINPDYLEAYGNRSIARYSLKDLTGAMKDCDKVLQLNPGNANATALKTTIQQELGRGK